MYCNWKFLLIPSLINPSSSEIDEKYFSKRLTTQKYIFASNFAKFPDEVIEIAVFFWRYPIPDSITFISINWPFSIIGVRTAPLPCPKIFKSGGELYPFPE